MASVASRKLIDIVNAPYKKYHGSKKTEEDTKSLKDEIEAVAQRILEEPALLRQNQGIFRELSGYHRRLDGDEDFTPILAVLLYHAEEQDLQSIYVSSLEAGDSYVIQHRFEVSCCAFQCALTGREKVDQRVVNFFKTCFCCGDQLSNALSSEEVDVGQVNCLLAKVASKKEAYRQQLQQNRDHVVDVVSAHSPEIEEEGDNKQQPLLQQQNRDHVVDVSSSESKGGADNMRQRLLLQQRRQLQQQRQQQCTIL